MIDSSGHSAYKNKITEEWILFEIFYISSWHSSAWDIKYLIKQSLFNDFTLIRAYAFVCEIMTDIDCCEKNTNMHRYASSAFLKCINAAICENWSQKYSGEIIENWIIVMWPSFVWVGNYYWRVCNLLRY